MNCRASHSLDNPSPVAEWQLVSVTAALLVWHQNPGVNGASFPGFSLLPILIADSD